MRKHHFLLVFILILAFLTHSLVADANVSANAGSMAELSKLKPTFRGLCQASPQAERSRTDEQIASERARLQSLYLIPQVSLTADFGLTTATAGNQSGPLGSGTSGSLGILAELNLNPLLGPHLISRKSDLALQASRLTRTTTLQAEFEQVLDQILALSSLWWRDQDLEETKIRLEKQYRTLQQNVRAGVARQRDQYRFEADLLRLQESRISLKRQIVEAQERVNVLVGMKPEPGLLDWKNLLMAKLEDVSQLVTSPQLEISRLKLETSDVDASIVRESTGFTASLLAGAQNRNSSLAPAWSEASVREPFQSSWFSVLSLKYPLWDGGSDRLKRQEASQNVHVASLERAKAERDFESKKKLLVDEVARLESRIQLANRLNLLERKSFELVATDYREGRAGYLDWIGASESLQNSVRAQIELAVEWAKLWMKIKTLKGEMAGELCD